LEEDILEMTGSDRKRLSIIVRCANKEIRQKSAASILGISSRQVKRLIHRYRVEGDRGVIHKMRGQRSHNSRPEEIKSKILSLYCRMYEGFGPTFAAEKLQEEHGLQIHGETLRLWLKGSDIAYPSRRARPHRSWRRRKSCLGEMVQLDGSHHDWLEGRGEWLVLMAYIDDANNRVFARFYRSEENYSALDSFRRYIEKHGVPCSLYLDRHTVYKAQRRPLEISEQLDGINEPLSNFQRAAKELGVEIIHAYSPQAKGRIERLFKTLQDRLVKELRLKNICTKEEANAFLSKYLVQYNRQFCVPAENTTDLHRKLSKDVDLRKILCLKERRTVKNDFTISFGGKLYQIRDRIKSKTVTVEIWLDSSIHFVCEGKELRVKELPQPIREVIESAGKSHPCISYQKPRQDHPWRQPYMRKSS
jgi:transposase